MKVKSYSDTPQRRQSTQSNKLEELKEMLDVQKSKFAPDAKVLSNFVRISRFLGKFYCFE